MSPPPRPPRGQRRRIFLGCEGQSELGYAARLKQIIKENTNDIHLHTKGFNGGDQLTLLEACEKFLELDSNTREPFEIRALLLDGDLKGADKNRDKLAATIAARIKIKLIWQEPCHEAFLLRHLDGCSKLRPASTSVAMTRLISEFPGYEKGLSARRLAIIGHTEVLRAAAVEIDLQNFLKSIGLIS